MAFNARVSSHGRKDNGDLDRQLDSLLDLAHDNGRSVETTYTDVGSGLNEERRELNNLLDDVQDSDYGRVLITYQNRLTRFGFSYLERLLDNHGITITVIEDETHKTAQEEPTMTASERKLTLSGVGVSASLGQPTRIDAGGASHTFLPDREARW